MKFQTKYNIGDEVIISGIKSAKINEIIVNQRLVRTTRNDGSIDSSTIVIYQLDVDGKDEKYSEDGIICKISDFEKWLKKRKG